MILQAAYGAVDLLVVGQFGSTAGLSAVSTGSQVLNLVTFVVTQLAMGVTVLIARYLGEQREKQMGSVLGGAAVVFSIFSVVLFSVLVFFARPIAVLMQAPEEAVTSLPATSASAAVEFYSSLPTTCFLPFSGALATADHRCCLCMPCKYCR